MRIDPDYYKESCIVTVSCRREVPGYYAIRNYISIQDKRRNNFLNFRERYVPITGIFINLIADGTFLFVGKCLVAFLQNSSRK